MTQNTIPGTRRQTAVSRTGGELERSYIYLTPATWRALYDLSGAADMSASKYIESLIPTECGTSKIKDKNERFTTQND